MTKDSIQLKKAFILAAKIGLGTSLAVFLAHLFALANPTSAGTIALLTLVTTKKGTIVLIRNRVITFIVTIVLCYIFFDHIHSDFIAFGLTIFFLVLFTEIFDMQTTLSVCALITMHYFTHEGELSPFILNEFFLLAIGVFIAFLFNLFNTYSTLTNDLLQKVQKTDENIKDLLYQITVYMETLEINSTIWKEIVDLESTLQLYKQEALEFQDNTFSDYPQYFIDYFEMRIAQLEVLHHLHYDIRKIRMMPVQSKMIHDFILFTHERVLEHDYPMEQLYKLQEIHSAMKKEPLPVTRIEFENRAILYHIMLDLESFLRKKEQFIENLDENALNLYTINDNGTKRVIKKVEKSPIQ